MTPIIDFQECQRDSPKFRQWLNTKEKTFFNVENKIEKAIKQCYQVVSSGRTHIIEQKQLVGTLLELSGCLNHDPLVGSSIRELLECLKETVAYQQILIDQTSQTVVDHLSNYIKSEVKHIKDVQQNFEKSSTELDNLIHKSAGYYKLQDSDDSYIQLNSVRKAFRHCAIDYAKALGLGIEKNRYEVLLSTLSHTKAYSTFFHQGSDLFNGFGPTFHCISQCVGDNKLALEDIETGVKAQHMDVSGEEDLQNLNDISVVTKQGYLFKRSTNAFKTWNYRYFILENNKLCYQKRSGEEITVMEEDMRLCNVKISIVTDRRFCFEITSNAKTHLLQAESENSRKKWIEVLNRAIIVALSDETLSKYESNSEVNVSNDNSIHLIESPLVTSKFNIIEKIYQITGNDFCCDCYQPNPKWASINLGITLCIECSGIHRSLGVHLSKVRSLTLDHWDKEVLYVMEELGNTIINEIYLSGYDSSNKSDHIEPATPNCEWAVREKWIKLKYLDRKLVVSHDGMESLIKVLKSVQNCKELNNTQDNVPLDSASKICMNEETRSKNNCCEDSDIWNPIHISKLRPDELLLKASELSNLPLILSALALGANKFTQCEDGKSSIHYVVLSKSSAALELLLQNGLPVNVTDNKDNSPLHYASMNNNIFHVYRLLLSKANHKMKNKYGKTPLDLAIETNEPHLVTLLRVATLFDQLDRDSVEEEMKAIMTEITEKKYNKILLSHKYK